MNDPEELCPCGQPLHYTDQNVKRLICDFAKALGPTVPVNYRGRTWLIPRHYIALHGIKSDELQEVAQRFGFEEVKNE